MEQDTYRTALAAVQKICAEKGEADAADIAKAVLCRGGSIRPAD